MCKRKAIYFFAVTCLLGAVGVHADEGLRDPTRPYFVDEAPATASRAFSVSAIFISDRRRVAVVNGRTVTAGDRVDGATVTQIGVRDVSLDYRGQTISARLTTAKIRE